MKKDSKASRIAYWVATGWLSLGMLSTGIVQLIQMEEEVKNFDNLGYPHYLMPILGVWKILGVIAILLPGFGRVKEWAYAGFFFTMTGAAVSHILVKDPAISQFGPILLLILTVLSWYLRPDNRKL